jgi:hypothetical protein
MNSAACCRDESVARTIASVLMRKAGGVPRSRAGRRAERIVTWTEFCAPSRDRPPSTYTRHDRIRTPAPFRGLQPRRVGIVVILKHLTSAVAPVTMAGFESERGSPARTPRAVRAWNAAFHLYDVMRT